MIKIVTFFLIFIMVLAIFGKLRLPWQKRDGRNSALPRPRLCDRCGRYNLTGGRCRHCDGGDGDG